MRERLLTVRLEDCEVSTFRAGGPGGQNQNKRDTGVRIVHPASGAKGEAREHRTQPLNKTAAWERMIDTPTFKAWMRIEIARRTGVLRQVETEVEKALESGKVRVEVQKDGRWVEEA